MARSSIIKALDYLRYAVAGAIGGLAIVNTFTQIVGSSVTSNAESIAMAAGAALLAGIVKILHVV